MTFQGVPAKARSARATELLGRMGMETRLRHKPSQLSGGERQRVAIARALANDPSLILADEPTAALDSHRGRQVMELFRKVAHERVSAVIVVTHDQQDAFALADRVGLLRAGRLEQWSTPYDLYHRPRTRFAAEFVGQASFVPACCQGSGLLQTELGPLREGHETTACGGAVDVLLRPDDVVHDDEAPLRARIVERVFRGAEFLYTLELPSGRRVLSLVPSHHDHRIGEHIGVRLDTDHVVTFPPLESVTNAAGTSTPGTAARPPGR
jgi:iron(III) transport system ATP-binding protein